jgi:hypothetical protein
MGLELIQPTISPLKYKLYFIRLLRLFSPFISSPSSTIPGAQSVLFRLIGPLCMRRGYSSWGLHVPIRVFI